MGKVKNKAAVDNTAADLETAKLAVQTAEDARVSAENALNELKITGTATPEELEEAESLIVKANDEFTAAKVVVDELLGDDEVEVIALLNLQGKFLLPYDAGTSFFINIRQAEEIVESKYGEYVEKE